MQANKPFLAKVPIKKLRGQTKAYYNHFFQSIKTTLINPRRIDFDPLIAAVRQDPKFEDNTPREITNDTGTSSSKRETWYVCMMSDCLWFQRGYCGTNTRFSHVKAAHPAVLDAVEDFRAAQRRAQQLGIFIMIFLKS